MKNDKKVAIVITHYNQEKYLPELLKSIEGQTYENWVILFYDCCSHKSADHDNEIDRFRKLIFHHISSDSKVCVVRNNESAPIGTNRYLAVKRAIEIFAPDYVAIVDADDVWLEDKLDLQMPLFEYDSQVKMVFSDCYYLIGRKDIKQVDDYPVFTIDENYMQGLRTFHRNYPSPKRQKDVFVKLLTKYNFAPCPTLMFEVKAWKKLIRSTGYTSAEDYDWLLKFARYHRVDWCKEPLAYYRLHPSQLSRQSPARCTWEERDVVRIWFKLLRTEKESLWLLSKIYIHLLWLSCKYKIKRGMESRERTKRIAEIIRKRGKGKL